MEISSWILLEFLVVEKNETAESKSIFVEDGFGERVEEFVL